MDVNLFAKSMLARTKRFLDKGDVDGARLSLHLHLLPLTTRNNVDNSVKNKIYRMYSNIIKAENNKI